MSFPRVKVLNVKCVVKNLNMLLCFSIFCKLNFLNLILILAVYFENYFSILSKDAK